MSAPFPSAVELLPELVRSRLPVDAKTLATLQARAALIGCSLVCVEDDRGHEVYIISRDALCKSLASPADVDAWLKHVGGPNA